MLHSVPDERLDELHVNNPRASPWPAKLQPAVLRLGPRRKGIQSRLRSSKRYPRSDPTRLCVTEISPPTPNRRVPLGWGGDSHREGIPMRRLLAGVASVVSCN